MSSGNHLKTSENVTGFKGGTANLGKRASQDRVLHFKDADNWYDYNLQFGIGTVSEGILRQMHVTAQNVGLMRVLGPNPKDNFNRLTGMVSNMLEGEAQRKFDESVRGFLTNRLAEVDGTTRIPTDNMIANISSGVRAVQTMADLGAAVISSITDLASVMTELRYQGFDMFDGVTESISGLAKGRNAEEMVEIDAAIGVVFPSMIGEMHARFASQDSTPGMISKGMQLFFKYNGMSCDAAVVEAEEIVAGELVVITTEDKEIETSPKTLNEIVVSSVTRVEAETKTDIYPISSPLSKKKTILTFLMRTLKLLKPFSPKLQSERKTTRIKVKRLLTWIRIK